MGKRFEDLKKKLATNLSRLAVWLESSGASSPVQTKFVDLAPTDAADPAGVYSEALSFATQNKKVANIALTGPYGSGKSSIVQTFLKTYPRRALHISLAAFAADTEGASGKASRQEIERSILQQMLYGADANKLPLSRFKRIQSPGTWAVLRSLFILLGLLSVVYVFEKRDAVANGDFFTPIALSNGANWASFIIATVFLWIALHHFYVASFGISLKSISLKDIEMRPSSDNPDSILNRHLDEIIYFFQATEYDLVVIEDLDRFENADIFVTLREINGLVNENAGVNRIIRFLYALRDDMFVNTDRTKFFEFIVPVIPIINSSNAIDKVLEQGKRLALDNRLDRQFLREVSRYLNDLRLIQNVFNEYAIYVANLESDEENVLDANKLLAILIYKNVYPRDFERLHRGEGNLAGILDRQDALISAAESSQRAQIVQLEKLIDNAERQTPSNLKELRQIYSMALVSKLPQYTLQVSRDRQSWTPVGQLANDEVAFENILGSGSIYCMTIHNNQHQINISELQAEVDSERTYLERKSEVANKIEANVKGFSRRISDLRAKIKAVRTIQFNELLRLNSAEIDNLFIGFGENGELARFLILEGYLDDTYYQYTSLFHSGRLSPNDNKFLIQIRAFNTPAPDFPIDNPNEVIVAMRPEDFGQSYVLNLKIVDAIVGDRVRHAAQLERLLDFLSSDFEGCEAFMQAYYESGQDPKALIMELSKRWRGYIPAILSSQGSVFHVSQLVAILPEAQIQKLTEEGPELSNFVAAKLPQILAQIPEVEPERLAILGFEIPDLAVISEYPSVSRFMVKEGLFKISIENLRCIYLGVMGETDLGAFNTANFSTLRALSDKTLLERLDRDFTTYLVRVLISLEDNSQEDAEAILTILQREDLVADDVRRFIDRQTNPLPSVEKVPAEYMPMLFSRRLVEPNWSNCLAFIRSEAYDEDVLVSFLNDEKIRLVIVNEAIPNDEKSLPIQKLLLQAEDLSDNAYREYVRALPTQFKSFPEDLESSKLRILIDENVITFSRESFEQLDDALRVHFAAANVAAFLANLEIFEVDDEFLEGLLRSQISNAEKRRIVSELDLTAVAAIPTRAALVGDILNSTDVNLAGLDAVVAVSLITHTRPIESQVSLLNKLEPVLSNDDVRNVLSALPKPFSEIKTGYLVPRLANTAQNLALAKWLTSRKIISSWSAGGFFSDDIRINLFRR